MNSKCLFSTLMVLTACAAVFPARGAVILDQQQNSNPQYMAGFHQPDLAQSFQPGFSNVAGAGIFTQPTVGTGENLTIGLYQTLGGTLLASGTFNGATNGSWVDVFWSPVAVTPDTTYYLVFTSSGTSMGIAGDTNNPYSRGQTYANAGFQSFPAFDYTFRTYSDDAGAGQVPEPGSLLLVAGAGLLFAWKKTRS